jgi:hypothetical protein
MRKEYDAEDRSVEEKKVWEAPELDRVSVEETASGTNMNFSEGMFPMTGAPS